MQTNKFKDIFPAFINFKQLILEPLKTQEKDPLYLKDENNHYSQENIYEKLYSLYGEEPINYDKVDDFIFAFRQDYNYLMLNFYVRQKAYTELDLTQLADEFFINFSKTEGQNNATNEGDSSSATGTSNNGQYINDSIDTIINGIPINDATKSKMKGIASANSNASSWLEGKYNLYNIKSNSIFNTYLINFLNQFHIFFMQTKNIQNIQAEIDYNNIKFRSGENIDTVDYLGIYNKNENIKQDLQIRTIDEQYQNLYTFINQLYDAWLEKVPYMALLNKTNRFLEDITIDKQALINILKINESFNANNKPIRNVKTATELDEPVNLGQLNGAIPPDLNTLKDKVQKNTENIDKNKTQIDLKANKSDIPDISGIQQAVDDMKAIVDALPESEKILLTDIIQNITADKKIVFPAQLKLISIKPDGTEDEIFKSYLTNGELNLQGFKSASSLHPAYWTMWQTDADNLHEQIEIRPLTLVVKKQGQPDKTILFSELVNFANKLANEDIAGNWNFINDLKKNGKNVATTDEIPDVSNFVDKTSNQGIDGIKNFSEQIVINKAATINQHPVRLREYSRAMGLKADKTELNNIVKDNTENIFTNTNQFNEPILIVDGVSDDNPATIRQLNNAVVNRDITLGEEFDTGIKLGADKKTVWERWIQVGDPYASTIVKVSNDGVLINGGINQFLGITMGVIRRNSGNPRQYQLHNINAVSNAPDQHASIVYQDGNNISYHFASTMTLTHFKDSPFFVVVRYTKA